MKKVILAICCFVAIEDMAQTSNQQNANGVTTYMNPIQPGDHPDQTLMRVGSDYYSTGSNFHFNPYVCIVHSTDLVHWEVFARVVPSNWSGLQNDAPSAGTWQGALAQFGGYFWVYFSNNAGGGQYFCKATTMAGPWSTPTKMTGADLTGYDNSIFVDDDGTPYMLMKNGQAINRIIKVDKSTGNEVAGSLMTMDWINANNRYSWAEGPVMCKRNGLYYYFMAGDVSGGQYCMSSATLTATESAWTLYGNFFSTASSPGGFTGPNHISQPILLDDGTWWCLSHAYDNSGWKGQGRLGLLHQVIFDASGVPKGVPPSTSPVAAPNLPNTNKFLLNLPKEDYFTSTTLNLNWHFFNKTNATKYSLTANAGYLRLTPGTGTTHILQKEGGRYYSMITKVTVNATATGNQAGLRIMDGNDDLSAILYLGFNGSQKIGFAFNGSTTEVNNTIGNVVWLKIERALHNITGYYSADGLTWTQVGGTIDVSTLDNFSTTYNEWVGNSIGLYATGITADFDLFKYRDGFSVIKAVGYNNFYGVTTSTKTPGTVVTNSTTGDWLMLGGVSMSQDGTPSNSITVNAASASGTGSLEVWIDNISSVGNKIATIPITASGGDDVWKNYTASINVTGQHDLYLKFVGTAGAFSVNTVSFAIVAVAPTVVSPVTYCQNATASVLTATGTALKWYTVAIGGTALATAPTPSTSTVGSTTYYVSQTVNGVETSRSSIVVTINALPTISTGSAVAICFGTSTTLTATGGTSYKWSNSITTATNTVAPTTTTTYFVTGTNSSACSATSSVVVTVNTVPAAPTVITPINYTQGATATALTATGTSLNWYTSATGGTALTAAPVPTTTAAGTTNYYVSQTITACESPRATIAVVITAPSATISLHAGWNYVGCPISGSTPIASALSSIWSNVIMVKNFDVFYATANAPALNTLSNLVWGQGYLVKVSTACVLDWIAR